ncbi:hypothetical protein LA76x_3871 [Lysobacter antibioticus]|uniref:Uncharacterized protein n=1 Tax=Lysobacter antibioticus TaxID=84531 RepID=A0A0S2FEN6_LYSAN|nr:hypothetical protein LA76x_3871 [Lysobacter antibioticus]
MVWGGVHGLGTTEGRACSAMGPVRDNRCNPPRSVPVLARL